MSDYAAIVLISVGVLFDLLGCVGLLRLPDVYTRLQAATKCVTLGTCLILVGVAVWACGVGKYPTCMKALLCGVFILVTSPAAAHALARGAHRAGIKPNPSVVDRLAEDSAEDSPPRASAVAGIEKDDQADEKA